MKIIITVAFLLISCVSYATQPIACGKEWINLHKDNPDLVGVHVEQYPDNIADQEAYKDQHPVAVYYLFSNNMIHAVTYTPNGQVQDGQWYPAKDNEWIHKHVRKEFRENVFCAFWVK